MRAKHPSIFASANTAFQNLRGALAVKDGRVHTQNLHLAAADFLLDGSGTIGLDGSIDMKASFKTSTPLASSLISSAQPVRYLADRGGRIDIPIRITGTLSTLSATPDMSFVAQSLQRAAFGAPSTFMIDRNPEPMLTVGVDADSCTNAAMAP